jgi:hypothetical protein
VPSRLCESKGFSSRNKTDFLTGTRSTGRANELSSSVFLRVSAPPRLCERTGVSTGKTRCSRGGAEECRVIGFSGFSVSPCLRESNGFSRPKPGSLAKPPRRQEGRSNGVSSRLRGFARIKGFSSRNRTDFLTRTRRHGESESHGSEAFLRVSAPPREHRVFGFRRLRRENHEPLANPPKRKGARYSRAPFYLAGGPGFEPGLTESESVVLPLDDPPRKR